MTAAAGRRTSSSDCPRSRSPGSSWTSTTVMSPRSSTVLPGPAAALPTSDTRPAPTSRTTRRRRRPTWRGSPPGWPPGGHTCAVRPAKPSAGRRNASWPGSLSKTRRPASWPYSTCRSPRTSRADHTIGGGSPPRRRSTGEPASAGPALLDGPGDVTAGLAQRGNLGVDPVDHGLQPPEVAVAGHRAGVMGMESVDDLVESQPQVLQGARHPDPLHCGRRVLPVARRPALRFREHPAPLVEADRVDAHAGFRCDLADLHEPTGLYSGLRSRV